LGEELTTAFRRSGLIHIIVLSGYNMTIVAEAIIIILSAVLPFGASLLAGALGIALFAIMVGGGATVVRASLMAVIALFARFTGRIYSATVALFLAGTIMVFINPLVLRFDIGFQLSFIATLGLIYLAPLFEARLTFIPIRFGLRGVLATTTAAQLAVLPWLFYTIGEVSLVALPANLMVIPLIPLTMFLGFGVGLIGFVSYFGSHLISIFVYFLLSFELSVVNFFADLPGAVLAVPTIPLIIILIIYAIMIIFAINYNKRISTSLK
jgi:competence protein ComEC